jgi:hypothetical protein
MVPYRTCSVKELEDHFDQRFAVEPLTGSVPRPRALERALKDLENRRQHLCDVLGQLISPANATVEQIWRQLRNNVGSLEVILAMLHGKFRISLFKDYRCLNL